VTCLSTFGLLCFESALLRKPLRWWRWDGKVKKRDEVVEWSLFELSQNIIGSAGPASLGRPRILTSTSTLPSLLVGAAFVTSLFAFISA